jgi:Flp pilus assembly pilin Flp
MQRLIAIGWAFVREEDAPSMIEYALLAVLIAMVVAVAALTLGHAMSAELNRTAACVSQPITGTGISANCNPGTG